MTSRGWVSSVSQELAEYFRTAESVNGLASSWTPLVDIAMGGAVTSTNPERRFHAGGRFALGPAWKTAVSKHREIRRALLRLPWGSPSRLDVLWVAHGPVPWGRVLDEGLGTGMSSKVAEHLDPQLFGVALLTPEAREGTRGWDGPVPLTADDHRSKHLAWRAPGAWLVDLVLVAKSRGKRVTEERRAHAVATLSEIGRSALTLLRCAEDAYRDERERGAREAPPVAPLVVPKQQRRRRSLEGLDRVEFTVGGKR